MVRGKTQMRRIENAASRQVTFTKRRNGLLKKAYELSVLCDAEVALVIFSARGKLYEFASSSVEKTIERYMMHGKNVEISNKVPEKSMQSTMSEATTLADKIQIIEAHKRKLLGEDLGSCSVDDLNELEVQLEKSLRNIKETRRRLLFEQIAQLKETVSALQKENVSLREQFIVKFKSEPQLKLASIREVGQDDHDREEHIHVETELMIGRPGSSLPETKISAIQRHKCHVSCSWDPRRDNEAMRFSALNSHLLSVTTKPLAYHSYADALFI